MERIDEHLLQFSGVRALRRYAVELAGDPATRRAAQALRWRVFAQELGVELCSREPGIDHDEFDLHCEHLVVREAARGEVVGTYRILGPQAARRIGSYPAEAEFDLGKIQWLRPQLVEVGRICIDPAHRNGTVIALLWSGIARYLLAGNHAYFAGSVSMSLADGGHAAASVFERLRQRHLAAAAYRVFPRRCLPLDELDALCRAEVPPLMRGYLRAGAWICGEPAWNPDFGTADFFLLLPLACMSLRYARHFMGARAS